MVNTVRKSIMVLNTLAQNSGLATSELARLLELPKSSVHNILTTLESERLVERNPETGKFHLGVKLISLGHRAQESLDIARIARPVLGRLNEETDETVHLTVLDEDEVLYVDCIESTKRLRTYSVIGVRAPLYCTSVGKAILAFQSSEYVNGYLRVRDLQAFTEHTLTDPDRIRSELARVRSDGYAVDNMEHEDHIRCIGAPIRSAAGEVFASISVSGPSQRMAADAVPQIAASVVQAADTISDRLGYHPGRRP